MIIKSNHLTGYTKPKRKTLKIVLLIILFLILGIGIWVGARAYSAFKKITSFSTGNNFLSFLGDSRQALKGESDGRTNILLLGMGGKNHSGGLLTDSIMVLSINWQTKKVAMISIPRDLWVTIPGHGSSKINEAYSYGESNSKLTGGGGKVASDTVGKVLGIPVHYFITVDFEGFKKIVNEVGGLDITVEKDLYDPSYPAANMIDYDPFRISAGEQHMDGAIALKYARCRKGTCGDDFGRAKRQQQVLAALKLKLFDAGTLANPKQITDLMGILGDHIRTDMSINEMKSFYDSSKDFDFANMINKVFDTATDGPLTSSTSSGGAYIIIPKKGIDNFIDLQTIAKNIFIDSTNITTEATDGTVKGASLNSQVKIQVLNASGVVGQAKKAADRLMAQGYTNIVTGDSSTTRATSLVNNCSGTTTSTLAQKIADILIAQEKTLSSCGIYDIQVLVGKDAL